MSEFDNLKNEAEQFAQQDPQQVKEGEDAAEKKFGMGQQDQSGQGGPQDQYGQGQQDQGKPTAQGARHRTPAGRELARRPGP